MTAYVIVDNHIIHDGPYEAYIKAIGETVEQFNGKYLVRGGEIIFSEEIKQHEIAYIDNNARSFFMRLSCIENLYYFASLNYIERCEVDKLLYNDFDDWGLDEFIFKKVNEISLGQSQCLKIIMAHLKSPKVYLYDEVFSSLDDNKKLKLKNFVQKIKKNNCIQIITSHDKKVLKEFADVEIFL